MAITWRSSEGRASLRRRRGASVGRAFIRGADGTCACLCFDPIVGVGIAHRSDLTFSFLLSIYMKLSPDGLQAMMQKSVVELVFTRRHVKDGWPMGRRMLCTLDRKLLQSLPGRMTLNFRVPSHPPPYVAKAYNLVVTWDIFWQDYRAIPVDSVQVVSFFPTHNKKEQDKFWAYFTARFQNMSAQDKIDYMKRA